MLLRSRISNARHHPERALERLIPRLAADETRTIDVRRHPDVDGIDVHSREFLRRDSDDGVWPEIDVDAAADDAWIGVVVSPPECVGENEHLRGRLNPSLVIEEEPSEL